MPQTPKQQNYFFVHFWRIDILELVKKFTGLDVIAYGTVLVSLRKISNK